MGLFRASIALEWAHLARDKAFVALTALAAVSFLAMVSLFGLTGARAPVALIDHDGGSYAKRLAESLDRAHHSFALKNMTEEQAAAAIGSGRLVGIVTIPKGFGAAVESGQTVALDVRVDNVNADMTNDVQRALPAAIVDFGAQHNFPGVRVRMSEHDVLPHDTGYIPYLTVSALALDAMLVAGILGALATAREWERGTLRVLQVSPSGPGIVMAGRLTVAVVVASAALLLTVLAMVFLYGVVPVAPWTTGLSLLACVIIFTSLGAWLGTRLKRTLAVAPLLFGMVIPLYVDSGALEPSRFDGETIWRIAHLSPVYYAVGVLEWAYHGIRVTPEPVWVDLAVLSGLALGAGALALGRLQQGATR